MISHNLEKYPVDDKYNYWIPFDQATSQLKRILSLLKLGGVELEIKEIEKFSPKENKNHV